MNIEAFGAAAAPELRKALQTVAIGLRATLLSTNISPEYMTVPIGYMGPKVRTTQLHLNLYVNVPVFTRCCWFWVSVVPLRTHVWAHVVWFGRAFKGIPFMCTLQASAVAAECGAAAAAGAGTAAAVGGGAAAAGGGAAAAGGGAAAAGGGADSADAGAKAAGDAQPLSPQPFPQVSVYSTEGPWKGDWRAPVRPGMPRHSHCNARVSRYSPPCTRRTGSTARCDESRGTRLGIRCA